MKKDADVAAVKTFDTVKWDAFFSQDAVKKEFGVDSLQFDFTGSST